LRDRDRTITLLRGELTAIKGMPGAGDADAATLDGIDLGAYQSVASVDDAGRKELEARVAELESQLHVRQARIAELMHEQGTSAVRIPQLEQELASQRKRSEVFERERHRQDKWLDILNDQLARARETNDKLSGGMAQQQVLQQRIDELEAECKRLGEEIAERERRLAAKSFECATARTTVTHLQAQLDQAKTLVAPPKRARSRKKPPASS
jgi:chromosome segregation ATPase